MIDCAMAIAAASDRVAAGALLAARAALTADTGRGNEAAKKPHEQRAALGTNRADRRVAGKAHRGDDHDRPAKFMWVQDLTRTEAAVGKDRQQQNSNHQQFQRGCYLEMLQAAQEVVENGLLVEEHDGDDCDHRGLAERAGGAQHAQHEGQHQGHFGSSFPGRPRDGSYR
jgi:hypothetical protein